MNPKKSFDMNHICLAPRHILNVPTLIVTCTTVYFLFFSDASDEIGCPHRDCLMEKMVNCNYTTACIRSEWICDGNDDCWDNSDEENCDTDSKDNGLVPNQNVCPRESTFQCDNGKCISLTWLCDLEEDCEGKFKV